MLPGISDHTSIASIDILCHPSRQKSVPRTIHLWARANLDLVKQTLNDKIISFCEKFQEHSVENQWLEFKTIVKSTMDRIPSKKIPQRFNQPWFTRKCNKLSKRKKRLYKRAKRTNMNTDWERFKTALKDCKKECKAAHDKYLSENIFNEEENQKKFYSYVKSKRQDNVSVSALKVNGSYVIDDVKKANVLNNQYSSVFSKPDNNIPEIKTPEVRETIPDIIISTDGVKSLLHRVNPTKAAGPDDISSRFLHEFSNELAPALTLIFSTSYTSGKLPDDWLHARVSPI